MSQDSENPLSGFAPFIGGQWWMEGSYQTLEWGPGQKSVVVRHYFPTEAGEQLVSLGTWYWHPADKKIYGIFSATNMPVELFQYVTRFEGKKMVSQLTSYTPTGASDQHIEEWELTGDDSYQWRLLDAAGEQLQMGGTFERRS